MKAKELRIGNIIRIEHDAFDYEVIEIRRNALELDSEKGDKHINSISFSSCKPIPLTEEWFKRPPDKVKEWKGNGADYQPETSKTVQHYYELAEDVYLVFQTWSWRKNEEDEWNNEYSVFLNYWNNEIHLYKFEIHVLQNLYFALTGEELTIKE